MADEEDPLLDLSPGIGQVASMVLFDVLTQDLEPMGEVHPESGVTISNNTQSEIMRTLKGFRLAQHEAQDLNLFTDRIRPRWVLEDGRWWGCGVFMFVDKTDKRRSYQSPVEAELWDQNFILVQKMREAHSKQKGQLIVPAIVELAEMAGITRINVDGPDEGADEAVGTSKFGQDILYAAGDKRSDAIRRWGLMAGLVPPYFDRDGVLRLTPVPKLEDFVGILKYDLDRNARIVDDSINEKENLLQAPNVFVVANSGSTKEAVMSSAQIRADLPHSVDNRGGVEVVDFERVQGLEDTTAARRMVRTKAAVTPGDFAEVTFDSSPDPRHDTFDVVLYRGTPYRETSWDLECSPGGRHSHRLNRAGIEEED